MWIFYLIALLPIMAGVFLYIFSKEVVWKEWLLCAACSFALAGIFHSTTYFVMTNDHETWSGLVTDVGYMPRWEYEYTETYTTTDDEGNVTTHTRVVSGYKGPDWWTETTLGKFYISEGKWNEIKGNFGGEVYPVKGYRPDYDSGDKNDYHIRNSTGYVEPVNDTYSFRNRFKASQNVMSFISVPGNINTYSYPKNPSTFVSGRLLGGATSKIPIKMWDQMNARIGAAKKVNVIMIEYPAGTPDIQAKYQEAKWLGGKKNDLVLCYSENGNLGSWAYVFGWTERVIVKRNLETILLTNKIDNGIIPLIEKEVIENYQIKDWHKFDYLTIYPPMGVLVGFIIVMLAGQVAFWWWGMTNDFAKYQKTFNWWER